MSLEVLIVPLALAALEKALREKSAAPSGIKEAPKQMCLLTSMKDEGFFNACLRNLGLSARVRLGTGDLSFEKNADGVYEAVFDVRAQQEAQKTLDRVEQEYVKLVQEDSYQKVLKMAQEKGYQLAEEKAENGEVRLLFRKYF
mgnify:CR=1 FL=1